MSDWDYTYLQKDSHPIGFEHNYVDTMVGVVRTGLAIVGVFAAVFVVGFCAGYFWGVR